MRIEYTGLAEINGSLIALDGVKGVSYDELAEITLRDGSRRHGRVILIDGERVVLEVFRGHQRHRPQAHRHQLPRQAHDPGPLRRAAGPRLRRHGQAHRRPRRDLRRGAPRHKRPRHQPRQPRIPEELHTHRHQLHRRDLLAHTRAEAAHILRRRPRAQRAGRPDSPPGPRHRPGRRREVRHSLLRHGHQERHGRLLPPRLCRVRRARPHGHVPQHGPPTR